jgi:hypothetical protein
MEKFMLIFQRSQKKVTGMNPEQMKARREKWRDWIEKLRKTNRYVSGEPLLPGGKLVSGQRGMIVTDGPYTESKELVGSFFIITAENMNEAVVISKGYPDFDIGGIVQVRQVMKTDI